MSRSKQLSLRVAEIFLSIEGEGVNVGRPQIFVRLQGCTIGCRWCDTDYARDPGGGKDMTITQILAEVESFQARTCYVSVTGGDPLRQQAVTYLLARLNAHGYHTNLEVAGTVDNHPAYAVASSISADIKTPSSGVTVDPEVTYRLFDRYGYKTFLKAVVADAADLDFVLRHFFDLPLTITPEYSNLKSVVKLIMKRLPELPGHWRFIPQIHKLLPQVR